jgi:hypothetical protein
MDVGDALGTLLGGQRKYKLIISNVFLLNEISFSWGT